jgi:hypothetical protein
MITANCYERVYMGYVRVTGSPVTPASGDDLIVNIVDLADGCVENGYLDQLAAGLEQRNLAPGNIDGVEVQRDNLNIVLLRGDVLIHLFTQNPQTMLAFAPFIGPFLARQPA